MMSAPNTTSRGGPAIATTNTSTNNSNNTTINNTNQNGGNGGGSGDVASYVKKHRIHVLLDKLVKDMLAEKPVDSAAWMLRWFVERHRLACEERHLKLSPQRSSTSIDAAAGGGEGPGFGMYNGEKDETVQALEDAMFSQNSFERIRAQSGINTNDGDSTIMDHQLSMIQGGGGSGSGDGGGLAAAGMLMLVDDGTDGGGGALSHRSNGNISDDGVNDGGVGGGGDNSITSNSSPHHHRRQQQSSSSVSGGRGDVLEQYLSTPHS